MVTESSEMLFAQVLEGLGRGEEMFVSASREGVFTPAMTMWLMLCQKVNGERGLVEAVEKLQSGGASFLSSRDTRSRRVRLGNISGNSAGFSQARSRLKNEVVREFSRALAYQLLQSEVSTCRWHGRRVFLFDCTTVGLPHTAMNLERYRPVRNQHGLSHTPELLLGCCHELFSGIALDPRFGPSRGDHATSEQQLFYRTVDAIPRDSLLIADRNFGVFPVAYAATRAGVQVLVRLTSSRAKGFAPATFTGSANIDQSVLWRFGSSRAAELNIPAEASIPGRFIKHTVRRDGFRDLVLYFYTTATEPAEELVALYAERERIENDIRSLKYTVGLEMLDGKTPEMIEKELLLGVAGYNLVRTLVAQAALEKNIPIRRISFSRGARLVALFGAQLVAGTDKHEQQRIWTRFTRLISQSKLPERKQRRVEPRKVVRKRQRFPLMKKSRTQERQQAYETLQEHGHRGYFTTVTRKR